MAKGRGVLLRRNLEDVCNKNTNVVCSLQSCTCEHLVNIGVFVDGEAGWTIFIPDSSNQRRERKTSREMKFGVAEDDNIDRCAGEQFSPVVSHEGQHQHEHIFSNERHCASI